jgi:hypothetical protein
MQPAVVYKASQSILVVGDGDFSFSAGLCKHIGTGEKIVATSLDTGADCVKKYGASVRLLAGAGNMSRVGRDW